VDLSAPGEGGINPGDAACGSMSVGRGHLGAAPLGTVYPRRTRESGRIPIGVEAHDLIGRRRALRAVQGWAAAAGVRPEIFRNAVVFGCGNADEHVGTERAGDAFAQMRPDRLAR